MRKLSDLYGPLLVLAGALCFSLSGFLQAVAPNGATPYVIAGCRMLIGSAALFVFCLFSRTRIRWTHWPWKYVFTYAAALWCYQVLFFNALLVVGVAVGTVVSIGVTPVASGLIDWFRHRKAPSAAWYLATALAIFGVFLINAVGDLSFSRSDLLLPVLAGVCYAVEISVSKPLTENHSAPEAMMLVMLLVGLALLPFFFIYPIQWIATTNGLLVAGSLGIVTAACSFGLMVAGLKTTPAPMASTLALAEPMGAALLGILVLHESCTGQTMAGIGCIFFSILVLIAFEQGKENP